MRILFVTLPSNIHALRWISQLLHQGWDIHVAASINDQLHPQLQDKVTFHSHLVSPPPPPPPAPFLIRALRHWPFHRGSGHVRRLLARLDPAQAQTQPQTQPQTSIPRLAQIIRACRPDIVHGMIVTETAQMLLPAHAYLGVEFPPLILGVWGCDVHFWPHTTAFGSLTRGACALADYLAAECERDVGLARELGFQGQALPVVPAGGGFDLEKCATLREQGPASARKTILLKGYQNIFGRALAGLRALELCADVLHGYRVVVQLASPDVQIVAEVMGKRLGVEIEIIPLHWHTDHAEVLRRYGRARIHIGLSISDGISTSMLESMVMGAFPIQSCTACTNEWIEDGKSGFVVPPEDPHIIANAIRRALTDDELVDKAAAINARVARERLAYDIVQRKVIAMYESVYSATRNRLINS